MHQHAQFDRLVDQVIDGGHAAHQGGLFVRITDGMDQCPGIHKARFHRQLQLGDADLAFSVAAFAARGSLSGMQQRMLDDVGGDCLAQSRLLIPGTTACALQAADVSGSKTGAKMENRQDQGPPDTSAIKNYGSGAPQRIQRSAVGVTALFNAILAIGLRHPATALYAATL